MTVQILVQGRLRCQLHTVQNLKPYQLLNLTKLATIFTVFQRMVLLDVIALLITTTSLHMGYGAELCSL